MGRGPLVGVPQLVVRGLDELRALAGAELGPTPWLLVDQERIDLFARSTDDPQWIHTDPVRAAGGPFGTTIAHGFLTLALAVRFWYEAVRIEGIELTVNYGVNRVRFPAPVPAGSRLRGSFRVLEVADVDRGLQATIAAAVERESHAKPACVAELLLRFLA
jgi:acyl dehydratase